MTDEQRLERGRRASLALEEFLTPAFDAVHAEYLAHLKAISAQEPWAANKIAALANATRIVEEVRGQITALVYDGAEAKAKKTRSEKIADLSPARRRLLNIGSH